MRLTLRTMLAFLDGILAKPDSDTLAKKIQDSEYASNLVQRLRDVTRRTRLGAPKVEGRGLGLDPNSVSEFLDSTMPPERYPEFERVCLDSDVHLAEVASCHQILTMVLGEPAEIDPGLRDRMYDIASQPNRLPSAPSTSKQSAAGESQRSVEASASRSKIRSKKPPAEMVEAVRRKSWLSIAPTIGLAFVVTILALRAMGRFDRNHPLYQILLGGRGAEIVQADLDPQAGRNSVPEVSNPSNSDAFGNSTIQPNQNLASPESTDAAVGKPESNSGLGPAIDRTLRDKSDLPDSIVSTVPEVILPKDSEAPSSPPPDERQSANATVESAKRSNEVAVVPTEKVGAQPAVTSIDPSAIVGRFISDAQILSVWNAEAETWFRLGTDAPLRPTDQLLAYPVFRSQVLLAPGFKLTFAGPSRCTIGPPDADGWPGLSLEYGRFSIVNTEGKSGSKLHFDFAGRTITARFLDANTSLAVEHVRYLAPGNDPLLNSPQNLIVANVTKGKLEWLDGNSITTLSAGQASWSVDGGPGQSIKLPPPAWLDPRTTSTLNANAARELEALVSLERPIGLSLMEGVERRQVEVRALAIRCLVHMDEYGPLLAALSNEAQHSYWSAHVEALRFAVTRSSDSASRFMSALEKFRPHDASQLYRMSWGFSPEQLAAGSAADLVAALEHKTMDIRVLALENLHRITGMTKFFRPEKSPDQQKLHLRSWNKALEDGEISYKIPPTIQSTFQPPR